MSEFEELMYLLKNLRGDLVPNPSITINSDGAANLHGVGTYEISQILPVLRVIYATHDVATVINPRTHSNSHK
jgi:hypothetical protein